VYKAKEKRTQRQFALKKVPTLNDEAARRDIEFEAGERQLNMRCGVCSVSQYTPKATLLKCAKSPHVVGFFGSWLNGNTGEYWVFKQQQQQFITHH
jgi:hypothetical protein